jgi:rhodanese-related sulfurtransferase
MSQLPASPTGLFNKFDVLSKSSAGTAVIEEPPVDVEVPQITAAALKQRISTAPDRLLLIDVRHSEEHAIDHLPGSTLVPFSEITRGRGIAKIQTLLNQWQQEHPDQPPCDLIVYCTAGIRSEMALCLLKQVNISGTNLQGGIRAWHHIDRFKRSNISSVNQPRNYGMNQVQPKHSFLPTAKFSWLSMGLCATVLGVGLLSWYSYKVVNDPDRLRPMIQAGVPLHLLSGIPIVGTAIQVAELPQITVQELKQKIDASASDYLVVDVRNWEEYKDGSIPGAVLIPWPEIESGAATAKLQSMAAGRNLYVYCTTGLRSGKALLQLQKAGIQGTQVKGGIAAWHHEKYSTVLHK